MGIGKMILVAGAIGLGFVYYVGSIQTKQEQTKMQSAVASRDQNSYLSIIAGKDGSYEGAGTDAVTITWNSDGGLTAGTFLSGFYVDVAKNTQKIFESFLSIKKVKFVKYAPFVDIRGNSKKEKAVEATFTRSNSSSIQWSNILYSNIPRLADSYWQHPSFVKK